MGWAVIAILAVPGTALAAAPEFHVEKTPAALEGSTVEVAPVFTFKNQKGASLKLECASVSSTGTQSAGTSTEINYTENYKECELAGIAAAIDWNGCQYRDTLQVGTNPPTALRDVVCPAGKEITFTSGPCTIHMPPQLNLSHVIYHNLGVTPRRLKTTVTLGAALYKITPGCPGQTATESRTDGTLVENVELKASVGGVPTGIWAE